MNAEILKSLSNKPVTSRDLAGQIRKKGFEEASKSAVNKILYAMEREGKAKRVEGSMPPLWLVGGDDQVKRVVFMAGDEDLCNEDIENIPSDVEIHMIGPKGKVEREGILFHSKEGDEGKELEILIDLLSKETDSVTVYCDGELFSRKLIKQLTMVFDQRIKLERNIDF